ncbi:Predicted ATPase [Chitinophaga sp. CF118]|uniref:AAA family ATPase n=1 Tax=Chitinophaga sp. CF118 TaxID=1884367 RepID=UPI0008E97B53|nr:AAA family ATPase [Chitinophaga sp. CF118]SFD20235.1 Predicted ATPase [Chitinophaga sp. CF118]
MSDRKLKEVTIEGYKSIQSLTISVNDVNVLIGANGAGKSNFISAFKFLRNIIQERLQISVREAGGADTLLFYGSKQTKNLSLSLSFTYDRVYKIILTPSVDDNLFFEGEYCIPDSGMGPDDMDRYLENFNPGGLESKLKYNSKAEDSFLRPNQELIYNTLSTWRVYHFHDTSESAGVKKYGSLSDNHFLFEDASNLAAFLYMLQRTKEDYYNRIIKTIRLVIPFFSDFLLRPNRLNPDTIRLEWTDKNSEKTFSASSLSDGSLRFICLATLLLQPVLPGLILLDEPELGLHPAAISILADLIKKAATNTQVILSTQSVNLVNEFQPEDIIVVNREGDHTSFKRLDNESLKSWMKDYSLGQLWESNVIGGRPPKRPTQLSFH